MKNLESKENIFKPTDLSRLKAELFTYGIRFNKNDFEILKVQNPFNQNRSGLSAGRFIELNGKTVINIPFWEPFVQYSPYGFEEGKLFKETKPIDVNVQFVPTPMWINQQISGGNFAGQVIQPHGKGNLATMAFGCELQNREERCRFCTASSFNKRHPLSDNDLVDSLDLALNENLDYSLSINAGTLKTLGRGLEILIPTIKKIRDRFPKIGLMLEIAPPKDTNLYYKLVEANRLGNIGLMLNLNFWSDTALNIVEPGKNKFITRDEYFETWIKAIEVFGKGNVSSCILCGIEAEEYTRQAIDSLTDLGVIPEIIMYRPTIGSELGQVPLDPELFLRLSNYAKYKMAENKIKPAQVGCVNCGGCSLTTTPSTSYS